jgi:hypothetical protein
MIAPPILPSISLTSNAIHKPFFILRTLRCPLMLDSCSSRRNHAVK